MYKKKDSGLGSGDAFQKDHDSDTIRIIPLSSSHKKLPGGGGVDEDLRNILYTYNVNRAILMRSSAREAM